MIKTFEQWINRLNESDELCAEYYGKVRKSVSNKQLVDICLDSNGISYLCEMQAKGIALPYEVITKRFGSFINGRYISEHKNERGNGYSSCIYCCFQGNIKAETTLITLLGCNVTVNVNPNHIIQVYADKNTELKICCPETSKAIVHYWGNVRPKVEGNVELIKEV